MNTVTPGIYRHYKGKEYEVLGVAHHSETLEELVVYRARYDSPEFGRDAWWVRPLSMFIEDVEVNGTKMPRFARIDAE
jgi:hypothetical protein